MRQSVMSRRIALHILVVGALISCTETPTVPVTARSTETSMSLAQERTGSDSVIPGAYLIQLKEAAGDVALASNQILSGSGAQRTYVWQGVVRGFSVRNLPAARAAQLERHPLVKLIEPDRVGRISDSRSLSFENGSYQFSHQWGLDRIDKLGAYAFDGLFNYTLTGAGVHIYIVDTGVRGGHQQFAGRIGNGSCHVFFSFGCSQTIDVDGHGTRMAGMAAGATYGVATGATIHPVRVSEGGSIDCSDAVDGLHWIRDNVQYPAVVSISWNHYPGCFSVRDAIDGLIVANILVVKSAGNNNVDAFDDRSNRSPGAVIVGGTDALDARAVYAEGQSNWGGTVTLMAPSINLRTANSGSNTDSVLATGTSPAAALAAGVAATVLQGNGTLSANSLRSFLLSGASGVTITNGSGVANRVLFSHLIPSPPPPPPPPSINATINGSDEVRPNVANCYFSVSPSGGTGNYSYAWTKDGTPVGGNSASIMVSTPSSGSFTLFVTVSDGVYADGTDQLVVTVSGTADENACNIQ